jgi:hypothetical protein
VVLLDVQQIARVLALPMASVQEGRKAEGRRCLDYLMERPLSVEPIVRMLLEAGGVRASRQQHILTTLRLFRASVRGLDDLLDRAEAEPSGRASSWTRFGPETTARTSLQLWDKAVRTTPSVQSRGVLLVESTRMLRAVRLEEQVTCWARHAPLSAAQAAAVEQRIREKERGWWRLVAGLVADAWREEPRRWRVASRLLLRLADNWQRMDDARDFEQDVADLRMSSFLVEVLQRWPESPEAAPVPWGTRLEALVSQAAPELMLRREALLRELALEEQALLEALHRSLRG